VFVFLLQTKYVDSGDISFGPQRFAMAELQTLEQAITKLLNSSEYQSYDIEEWSMAMHFTSYLCLPDGEDKTVDLVVQVCPAFRGCLTARTL
jgi:hypothetical protein